MKSYMTQTETDKQTDRQNRKNVSPSSHLQSKIINEIIKHFEESFTYKKHPPRGYLKKFKLIKVMY